MARIIEMDRSIIPALDVPFERAIEIIKETSDLKKIGGYKIPATSGRKGWESWIREARKYTDKPLIYDHQKAGTDIPDTAEGFMTDLSEAGFDAVILFPQSGPITQEAWTKAGFEKGLGVIVGGKMTHAGYTNLDGGYISDSACDEMYKNAANQGVSDFVVPGNKPEYIRWIKSWIEAQGLENSVFYSPGLITQGGDITESGKAAGDYFHAIVGRGIKNADNVRQAAKDLTRKL